jgi:hypothetical protein
MAWLTIAVAAMRSQLKGEPVGVYLGKKDRGQKYYPLLQEMIGAKFILFCERDKLTRMVGHFNHASKIETTFRMRFKGGLHFLGEDENPIRIVRLHFDGHEHLHRHIDRRRIIDRINGLRSYCEISSEDSLIDDRSSDHRKGNSQDYDDCQLIQLADLMIGAFRSALRYPTREIHALLASHVRPIIERYLEGPARMQNSRWRNSFCMSECYLEQGLWKFHSLECQPMADLQQLSFPLSNFPGES